MRRGVWLPLTGIVDSHQYMLAQDEAENHGANIVFHTPVESIDAREGCFIVQTGGGRCVRAVPGVVSHQQRRAACK